MCKILKKFTCVCVYFILSHVTTCNMKWSGFSLDVTKKTLENTFPAVWQMGFLTDHCNCFSFKEGLSVGRCWYYTVPRVSASGTASQYSRPSPRHSGSLWPASAEGEEECSCWSLVLTLAVVNPFLWCPAVAMCWWVKNYISKFIYKS